MNMEEYLQQVEALLRAERMAPRDIEDARMRCGQYIINAGPGHEEEAMAELGTPEELAEKILDDYRQNITYARESGGGLNLALKIVIGIFLSPFIVAAYGLVFGLVVAGVCCVFAGGLSGIVGASALLTLRIGTFMNFLGGGFLAAGIGLLLFLGGVAFCKLCNFCMRRLFGARRYAV